MLRSIRVAGLSVAAAALALAMLPAGVGAVDGDDLAYWRSTNEAILGIGSIWDDTDIVHLHAGYIDLGANRSYRLVISSVRCNHTHGSSNTVLSRRFESNSHGAAFLKVEFIDIVISNIRSARIFRNGNQLDCANSISGQGSGDPIPTETDGVLGWMLHANVDRFAGALVEKKANDTARLSIVLDGLTGGDTYVIQGVSKNCGKPFTTDQRYFAYELKNVQVTSFKATTVELTQEELDSLRSLRIKNKTDGTKWGCVSLRDDGMAFDEVF